MKILRYCALAGGLAIAVSLVPQPATALVPVPSGWEYAQELTVATEGLAEVHLPPATLDKTVRGLDDIRVVDSRGKDVPFVFCARPAPKERAAAAAAEISQTSTEDTTVGVYRTSGTSLIDTIALRTPARDFIKPVTVEASEDRAHWRDLAVRYPVFRQSDGAERLDIRVAPGRYAFLRITVGDTRERPVPITGVVTDRTSPESSGEPDREVVPVTPASVSSEGGVTRILLNLPARHLLIQRLTLEPDDPVFSREVTVAVRTSVDGEVREQVLARGRLHRVAVAGIARAEVLSVPIPDQASGTRPSRLESRNLVVSIENGDSPPLMLRQPVMVTLEPVRLRFLARPGDHYALAVGNRSAKPPRYDLAALSSVSGVPMAAGVTLGPLERNPVYRVEELARGAPAAGGSIDASQWRRRRRVLLSGSGVLALEVPPEVLSRSPGLTDLRLIVEGSQIPYILERGSLVRRAVVPLEALQPERGGKVSRWRVRLPHPGLPLEELTLAVPEPVFQRNVGLYEEVPPDRGGRMLLAGALWERRGEGAGGALGLALRGRPAAEKLTVEVDDGDNPPLTLRECTVAWRTSRLLFKDPGGKEISLLYDNPGVGPPRYDLVLLADEILAADAAAATLSPDEQHQRGAGITLPAGGGRLAFWGALVLVVAVLIGVIAKLLPPPKAG